MSVFSFITSLAAKLSNNQVIKALLRPFYRLYLGIRYKVYHYLENRNLLRNGIETLAVFDKCLSNNGFVYSLGAGTLLGAIREKGFIKHDEDIDVFMWIDDFSSELIKVLQEYGFVLRHSYIVEGGTLGREDSFVYKGVQVDIFYVYPAIDQHPYFTDFFLFPDSSTREMSIAKHGGLMPRRVQIPIKKEIKRIQFGPLKLPVPVNADEVLSFRYGKDYMIPNPKWRVGDSNPMVTAWPEKIGIVRDYE